MIGSLFTTQSQKITNHEPKYLVTCAITASWYPTASAIQVSFIHAYGFHKAYICNGQDEVSKVGTACCAFRWL